jgi:hypothetical protein
MEELKIEKLDSDNYRYWSLIAQGVLVNKGCWDAVDPGYENPTAAQGKLDHKARTTIYMMVSKACLDDIAKLATAKEVWETLKRIHTEYGTYHGLLLLKDFVNAEKEESESITKYIAKRNNLYGKVSDSGFEMSEKNQCGFIVLGLPGEYEHVSRNLKDEDLTFTIVKAKLLEEERRIGQKGGNGSNGGGALRTGFRRSPIRSGSAGSRSRSDYRSQSRDRYGNSHLGNGLTGQGEYPGYPEGYYPGGYVAGGNSTPNCPIPGHPRQMYHGPNNRVSGYPRPQYHAPAYRPITSRPISNQERGEVEGRQWNGQRKMATKDEEQRCFSCNQKGHFSRSCQWGNNANLSLGYPTYEDEGRCSGYHTDGGGMNNDKYGEADGHRGYLPQSGGPDGDRESEMTRRNMVGCHMYDEWEKGEPSIRSAQTKEEDDEGTTLVMMANSRGGKTNNHEWVLDTAATDHMCCEEKWPGKTDKKNKVVVSLGDGSKIAGFKRGDAEIEMEDKKSGRIHLLELKEILWVPELKHNLISAQRLTRENMELRILRDKAFILSRDKRVIACGKERNGLYVFKGKERSEMKG